MFGDGCKPNHSTIRGRFRRARQERGGERRREDERGGEKTREEERRGEKRRENEETSQIVSGNSGFRTRDI
jgi:hypothetical protein